MGLQAHEAGLYPSGEVRGLRGLQDLVLQSQLCLLQPTLPGASKPACLSPCFFSENRINGNPTNGSLYGLLDIQLDNKKKNAECNN